MNLRAYYQRIREVSAAIGTDEVWIVSMATPEGGRAGVVTEVPRDIAARMIVDGKARLATAEEAEQQQELRCTPLYQAPPRIQVTLRPADEDGPAGAGKEN